jgi:hypothetical protein
MKMMRTWDKEQGCVRGQQKQRTMRTRKGEDGKDTGQGMSTSMESTMDNNEGGQGQGEFVQG